MQYLGKRWLAKKLLCRNHNLTYLLFLSINRKTVTKKRKLKYTFGIGMSFQNPCSKDIEKEKHLFGKILKCYRDQYNSNSICKYSDSKQERSFDPSNNAFAVFVNKCWIKQLFNMLLIGVVSALTLYLKHLYSFGSKYHTYLTILKNFVHSVILHMYTRLPIQTANQWIRWNISEQFCNRFHKSCKMYEMGL